MKKIPLNGKRGEGKFALVDDEDFDILNRYKWVVNQSGYVYRSTCIKRKYKGVSMHRVVMGDPAGSLIDHINRDPLDNRKENLRAANKSQNAINCGLRSTNTSGYKGVSWNKDCRKWVAHITKDFKPYHIGLFNEKEEAARAYDFKADEFFGEFAVLNFPGEPLKEYIPPVTSSANKSGYRGVSWRKDRKKWEAKVKKDGKSIYSRVFTCKLEAARQYNEWALELHGDRAKLNVISEEAGL